jgi:iron(III) transport system substrate-binding protein
MLRTIAGLLASVCIATPAFAGTVTLYTSLDEDEIPTYVAGMKEALPHIDVQVLRLSTGDLGARILAEANNPQNDIIWSWALTSLLDERILELLEPYTPKGAEDIPARFRDAQDRWFATTGYMEAFCVNTQRLEAKGLDMPTSWEDLADPQYEGEVLMPNPMSSGTGYVAISAILQRLGEEKGWELLHAVDKNIAEYTKSGSAPCKRAARGEYAVGASLLLSATQVIQEGYPVKMVVPAGGAGYEISATALMAGSKNKEEAKEVFDWLVSPEAVALYAQFKEIVPLPGYKPRAELLEAGLPEDINEVLFDVDFEKSTSEKARIVEEWTNRLAR